MHLLFSLKPSRKTVTRRLLAAALILVGCGGSRAKPTPASSFADDAPLNSFASLPMVVMPAQGIRGGDSLGWSGKTGDRRAFLAAVDSALATAVRDRGLTAWTLPSVLVQTARKNPTYVANPADVRAADAVRYLERKRDSQIPEPVASQLRSYAAFHDARHALIPVEVRFEPGRTPGTGRAVLRIAILDVRASRLVFVGDIAGPEIPDFGPAVASDLARKFTDLVVPR